MFGYGVLQLRITYRCLNKLLSKHCIEFISRIHHGNARTKRFLPSSRTCAKSVLNLVFLKLTLFPTGKRKHECIRSAVHISRNVNKMRRRVERKIKSFLCNLKRTQNCTFTFHEKGRFTRINRTFLHPETNTCSMHCCLLG